MNEIEKKKSKEEVIERKLLELSEIQLKVVESLYDGVQVQLTKASTSSNEKKIIKNVPMLKMNINSDRQRIVVQMKAQIAQFKKHLALKYDKE